MSKSPTMLIILDGYGIGPEYAGNAVYLGKTPNFDNLQKNYPSTQLEASGLSVGLPDGQMGNSEVGHLNIGSGRIVYQELTRISKAITDGDFFEKEEFLAAIDNAKENRSKIHLIGLVSDGGVHSHNTHIYALLELMKDQNFKDVYVHVILDGRDVSPTIGKTHIKELMDKMDELGVGKIATVSGRYYAMDRDKRWNRTELAYNTMVLGQGNYHTDPLEAVLESYEKDTSDEFIMPTVITECEKPVATIDTGDSIIFFNFRPDRMRQLTRALVDYDFEDFDREKKVSTYTVTMTDYDKTILNVHRAFRSETLRNTLGEYLSHKGLKQLRVAETEKYAHVTFFFNGGREEPFMDEDRILIPSPKVSTYDLKPEMSAYEVKDTVIENINKEEYDLIIVNFANPDMVGHTGSIAAAIKAVETVDECLGEIIGVLKEKGGRALITSDHGNSENLLEDDGSPVTSHTTNKVPLILFGEKKLELRNGILADISPTILDLMELDKPDEMTGKSLIQ